MSFAKGEFCSAAAEATCGNCVIQYVTESEWRRNTAADAQSVDLTQALNMVIGGRRKPETVLARSERLDFIEGQIGRTRCFLEGSTVNLPPDARPGNPVLQALGDCIARHVNGVCTKGL